MSPIVIIWNWLCPLHEGRQFTVSLALPGSILDNAQSPELRTYLAGQVSSRGEREDFKSVWTLNGEQ